MWWWLQTSEVQLMALEAFIDRSPALLSMLAQFKSSLQALVEIARERCQAAAGAPGSSAPPPPLGARQGASYDETLRVGDASLMFDTCTCAMCEAWVRVADVCCCLLQQIITTEQHQDMPDQRLLGFDAYAIPGHRSCKKLYDDATLSISMKL